MRTGGANASNIWLVNPETGEETQLTSELFGVNQYDVSADGTFIAYSARDFETNTVDIYRLNLDTNETTRLTNCREDGSICDNPQWRPDGQMIAYERSASTQSIIEIWILDLRQSPTHTFSLLAEVDEEIEEEDDEHDHHVQVSGDNPRWSADGRKIAFYARGLAGIMVYDLDEPFDAPINAEIQPAFIPTGYGLVGEFSPDGTQMVFPELVIDEPLVHANLQLATLDQSNLLFEILTSVEDNAIDRADSWHPDGTTLAITRRIIGGTNATTSFQVYLMNMLTREITPLVFDPTFDHGRTHWRPDGEVLLLQRTPVEFGIGRNFTEGSQIWLYDMVTNDLTLVAERAFQPRWIP